MSSKILSVIIAGDATRLKIASVEATSALGRVGVAATGASTSMERAAARQETAAARTGKALNKFGLLSTVVVAGIGIEAVKAAGKFEASMTRVHTQAGAPIPEVNRLKRSLLDLAPKVGVGPDALALSLYHVESAGFRSAEALDMTTASAKLAQIGNANLEASTQAIIAVMASRIKGVRNANDAVAILNTTVGIGDMKMDQLTKALATGLLPTAESVGLSMEDVSAALATLTDNATPAEQVATRLKTSLLTLIKPSIQQSQAFNQIGMGALDLAGDFRKPNGLMVAVNDLKTHLEATYPAAQSTKLSLDQIKGATTQYYQSLIDQGASTKEAAKLTEIYRKSIERGGSASVLAANALARGLGGSKTAGIFLTLIDESDRLKNKYSQLGTEGERQKRLQDAWAQTQQTYKQKVDQLRASWEVFLVKVGNAILPWVKKMADLLSKHPGIIQGVIVAVGLFAAAWVAVKIGNLISGIARLGGAIFDLGRRLLTTGGIASGAKGLGAIESGAAGATTGMSKFAGIGKSGPFIALAAGVAGIAIGIHTIMNDGKNIKLPSISSFGLADKANGLQGKSNTDLITAAMTASDTQDNKKENQLQYFQRLIATLKNGHIIGEQFGLSMKGMFQVMQKGTTEDLQGFLYKMDEAARASGASNHTIQQLKLFYTALFNRVNSGREELNKYINVQQKASQVQSVATANAKMQQAQLEQLNGVTGLNKQQVAALSQAQLSFSNVMVNGNSVLSQGTKTLQGNSAVAQFHRGVVMSEIVAAQQHAQAVYNQTGSLYRANVAFDADKKVIYDNATAIGYSKDQLGFLNGALSNVKANSNVQIKISAEGQFLDDFNASKGAIGANFAQLFGFTGITSARGNLFEDHSPQIADGRTLRMWAEPETGGEAYIPLASSKRNRSLAIWRETGKRLGAIKHFDAGGVIHRMGLGTPPYAAAHIESDSMAMASEWGSFAKAQVQAMRNKVMASSAMAGVGGGVARWAPLILQVLGMLGQSPSWLGAVEAQMNTESGGDPTAIDLWDSNAAIGQPSKGLMQTIDSTFNAYAGPFRGLGIYNPLANIYAGIAYALSRYGSLSVFGQGHGYSEGGIRLPMLADGGTVMRAGRAIVGEAGAEEVYLPGGAQVRPLSGHDGCIHVTVNVRGSVISERDLVKTVQDGIADDLRRKGKPTSYIK